MKTFIIGQVPCGDCRLCCTNELVQVGWDENGFELRPGTRFLAMKDNKECVYLRPEGCSVYERRPKVCREFDCRYLAVKVSEAAARPFQDTWKRGKELLPHVA